MNVWSGYNWQICHDVLTYIKSVVYRNRERIEEFEYNSTSPERIVNGLVMRWRLNN